jgi:hypothetical protein
MIDWKVKSATQSCTTSNVNIRGSREIEEVSEDIR